MVKDTSLYPASVLNKAQNEGTPKYGGTVTFGMESGVLNYSPNNKVIQPSDLAVEVSVFDSLITFDDKSQPVLDNSAHKYNQLADSLKPSKDLKTWTLKLRPGIKFSNGDPLTADEVVKHTDWIKSNASLCSCQDDANNIDTITAGAHGLTVTYKLKAANVDWLDKLSNGESAMLLRYLYTHATRPDFVYRHRWNDGDILVWDELATIHLAPSDYLPHERRVVRVTAGLTTPIAARDTAAG